MRYVSSSSAATKKLGELLARVVGEAGLVRRARVVALIGPLGAGKTTFVQGFSRGLGLRASAKSPTFIIVRRTSLRRGPFRNLFHMDAYRLSGPRDLKLLGFADTLADPKNVILIEWADRIRAALPKNTIIVRFAHGRKDTERLISFGASN